MNSQTLSIKTPNKSIIYLKTKGKSISASIDPINVQEIIIDENSDKFKITIIYRSNYKMILEDTQAEEALNILAEFKPWHHVLLTNDLI